MADTTSKATGSSFGFLGHKLFGKIPVWVVAVVAVGGYYWYTKYGPGKSSTSTQPAGSGTDPAGNTGLIDPSTGYVYGTPEDLAALNGAQNTGGDGGSAGGSGGGAPSPPPVYLPSPGGNGPGGPIRRPPGPNPIPKPRKVPSPPPPRRRTVTAPAPPGGKGGGGGGSGGPRSNTEWQGAAVSNLISQGVPPDMASTSVQAHLNGQPLSPAMAANTKLAVDSIGPPPQVPQPGQMKAPMTAGRPA